VQSLNITPTSGLSQDEVDRLVNDGEKFKETDQLRRDLAELNNQAETLIYTTEQALEGYGDLLDPEKIEAMREDLAFLKSSLQSGSEIDIIRDAYARLENATFEIAEAMYGGDET
jgi:molecular chaperone DnaK